MVKLRVILWDQLSLSISSLVGCDKQNDLILICELLEEATYVKHHKKKLAFLLSAMRHFAAELHKQQYQIEYIKIDDSDNTGHLNGEIARVLKKRKIEQIIVTHPGEYRILQNIKSWEQEYAIAVDIRPDDRFLCSIEEFSSWADTRTQLRMEFFYHYMRQKYNILMEGKKPIGGKWNYDSENRNRPPAGMKIPKTYHMIPDLITQEVIDLVRSRFSEHFGDLETFYFAVTRQEALIALEQFITERAAFFGNYQDVMLENEPWMYHSHLSFYVNCGLLLPMECIKATEKAYAEGKIPLNAAEGFIRQILGWREYVHGLYWLKMPDYKKHNFLAAKRKLPEFYWTGHTKMNCLRQCVIQTKALAYAHHIQRLMVLGNFALLTGIHPDYVNEWFLIVYGDAYEWVELPNVTGMILFADGGYLASKPYAASGAYINKMSNYCKNCSYNVAAKNGPDACPFNYLYWYFLFNNRKQLRSNQRLGIIYKVFDAMEDSKKNAIIEDSKKFLMMLENNQHV